MKSTASSIERLESRIAPAVIMTVADLDGDGIEQDVRLKGGLGNERVLIEDSSTGTKVFIDNNGNGVFTDPTDVNGQSLGFAVKQFEVNMGGGKDVVTVQLVGNYTTAKSFFVNLGGGNNEFHFLTSKGVSDFNLNSGTLKMDMIGGSQNDYLDVQFGSISSIVDISVRLGGGNDGFLTGNKVTAPSVIRFLGGLVTGGRVDADIDLGPGSNKFQTTFADASVGSFGAVTPVNIRITGSNVATHKDDVTASFSNMTMDTGANIRFDAFLGAGSDAFHARFDGVTRFTNSQITEANASLVFNVAGGAGNDLLEAVRGNAPNIFNVDGNLEFNFRGGFGNDTLKLDLSTSTASAQLTTQSTTSLHRALRVRLDGGAGNDTITALVSNTAAANFLYDIGLYGREGLDNLVFTGANNGGAVTYGPAGGAVIDGGLGVDAFTVSATGGFQTRVVN